MKNKSKGQMFVRGTNQGNYAIGKSHHGRGPTPDQQKHNDALEAKKLAKKARKKK